MKIESKDNVGHVSCTVEFSPELAAVIQKDPRELTDAERRCAQRALCDAYLTLARIKKELEKILGPTCFQPRGQSTQKALPSERESEAAAAQIILGERNKS